MLEIVADVHERRSGVPASLTSLGARVTVRRLTGGDYILGPGVVVERKTTVDLHLTIAQGRFWQQMRRLRQTSSWPFLLIEGGSLRVPGGGVPLESVRGMILSAQRLGIATIRSESPADTADWLFTLARRSCASGPRDRPVYAQRPKRSAASPPAEQALAAAPGISTVTARALLRHFGSLERVVDASFDELRDVEGVGRARASALRAMIHDRWDADSAH